jgi:tRNA(Ile)-lysidine synthetase-like protein
VRTIIGAWRRLTGGASVRDTARRTLVACSGGADSSALLLALASVNPGPEACHVVHDMRPPEQAERDADRTAALCDALGVPFHRAAVRVAHAAGNLESNARRARYDALAGVAQRRGLRFVATGHHADDQLETILMRLLRGAGARGLAGIRATRPLGGATTLLRPMLGVTRAEAESLCTDAAWAWNRDATNEDTSRLRAALRASVLPALRGVEPDAARRAARSGAAVASSADAVEAWAAAVLADAARSDNRVVIETEKLVLLPTAVMVSLIGQIYAHIVGESGRDRLSQQQLGTCIGGILSRFCGPYSIDLAEMTLRISEGCIEFCKK